MPCPSDIDSDAVSIVNASVADIIYKTSYQPVEVATFKVLHSYHSKKQLKSYCKNIQLSWYKKYPWITICLFQLTASYDVVQSNRD